nr:YciI family protein [Phaeovibrio sulfidiphilus]
MDEVDRVRPAHFEWLDRQYEAGVFLLSGRRTPPVGGIILARAESREALEAIVAQDPYVKNSVAEVEIIEFEPNKFSEDARALAGR